MNEPIAAKDITSLDLAALRAIICDLDGTLANSKVRCEPPILRAIERLLEVMHVGVISGGRRELIDFQVVSGLELDLERRSRLHLLPASGTTYLRWRGGDWSALYNRPLRVKDVKRAERILTHVAHELGYWEPHPKGPVMDNRGGQFTYSVLGQEADPDAKAAWDPSGLKKEQIIRLVRPRLPRRLTVSAGKSTSIDVTRKRYDKKYGVSKMLAALNLKPREAIFFGDRLDPGGNDRPVLRTGVPCIQVSGWKETLQALTEIERSMKAE